MEGSARRQDVVEQWIKQNRDEYKENSQAWMALDDPLDNYRLHADTGTPLDDEVDQDREV